MLYFKLFFHGTGPRQCLLDDSLQWSKDIWKEDIKCYSSKVFSVRDFSTAHPSPGNARGLICFPALAFHEVIAKEDMLGSYDGRLVKIAIS